MSAQPNSITILDDCLESQSDQPTTQPTITVELHPLPLPNDFYNRLAAIYDLALLVVASQEIEIGGDK